MSIVTRILFMAGYQAFWLATGAVVGGIITFLIGGLPYLILALLFDVPAPGQIWFTVFGVDVSFSTVVIIGAGITAIWSSNERWKSSWTKICKMFP